MKDNRDFSDLGKEIRDVVQDAIGSMEYGELNDRIEKTINVAFGEVRKHIDNIQDGVLKGTRTASSRTSSNNDEWVGTFKEGTVYSAQNRRPRRSSDKYRAVSAKDMTGQKEAASTALSAIPMNRKGNVDAIILMVLGGAFTGIGSVALAICLLLWVIPPHIMNASSVAAAALVTGLNGYMLSKGLSIKGRIKRAEKIRGFVGEKGYCSLADLADYMGITVKKMKRDLKGMIKAGVFPQGHLDKKGTCLMLTDKAWEQYSQLQKNYQVQKIEEQASEAETEEGSDEESVEALGCKYMERLRQLNDAIPGQAVSTKLERLDYLLKNIFTELKERPEKKDQMRKFMEYYLPETVRLVEAYEDFDQAGVQGENITAAKAEIEKTLDTINSAFEKLLDGLYRDAAFEASANAKVLKTILSQDGYGETEFEEKNEGEA